jgi:hypothetical protein
MRLLERVDLYSPWREGVEALHARHVGRERELNAIRAGARAFAGGGSPLPLYVFGTSGIGKSHLLTLAIDVVSEAVSDDTVGVTVVPEDAVAMRSPEQLFSIMSRGVERRPWACWDREPPPRQDPERRRVVIFEALDRQLRALGTQGRRELRRLLGEAPDMWLVCAGMTLPSELTGADEAFFGAFDPWPLDPLDEEEGALLLERVALESEHDPAWRAVRASLLTLAGGNPRTLAALAMARRAAPRRSPSELLHRVVHQFTAQYRNVLHGLSPQAQRMVTLFSAAPRDLGPAELASAIDSSTSQMSVQARRLEGDGVVSHRSDGRQTWYRLADPLFRYWLEYRSAHWDQTRVCWMARLSTAVGSPVRGDAMPDGPTEPWRAALLALRDAVSPLVDRGRAETALSSTVELKADPTGLRALAELSLVHDLGALFDAYLLDRMTDVASLRDVVAVAAVDRMVRLAKRSPRDALLHVVGELERDVVFASGALAALGHVLARAGHGRAWVLRGAERKLVAAQPFLRVLFLQQGRLHDHAPLVTPADVVAATSDDPLDARPLLVVANAFGHVELVRRAARAPGLGSLPRCHRPRVVDVETADVIARAMVSSLGARGGAATRDALSWVACLATCAGAELGAVLERLEGIGDVPLDDVHDVALAALLAADVARFERVEQALGSAMVEPCGRARQLWAQLAEAERGHLHPELAVIRDLAGDTR